MGEALGWLLPPSRTYGKQIKMHLWASLLTLQPLTLGS